MFDTPYTALRYLSMNLRVGDNFQQIKLAYDQVLAALNRLSTIEDLEAQNNELRAERDELEMRLTRKEGA